MAAVENVDELVAVLGAHDGVAAGRGEVGVPEAGLHDVDGASSSSRLVAQ